jgi:hypothetical protein
LGGTGDPNGKQLHFITQQFTSSNICTTLTELGTISGMKLTTDESGFLTTQGSNSLGSATAQKWVNKMLEATKWELNVNFNTVLGSYGLNGTINLNPDQINELQTVTSEDLDYRTMGWAMVLIEEFLHSKWGMNIGHSQDPYDISNDEIIQEMNKIRSELEDLGISSNEWGQEQSHY